MVPSVMQVHGHERKSQAATNESTAQDLAEIGNTQGFCRNDPAPPLRLGGRRGACKVLSVLAGLQCIFRLDMLVIHAHSRG